LNDVREIILIYAHLNKQPKRALFQWESGGADMSEEQKARAEKFAKGLKETGIHPRALPLAPKNPPGSGPLGSKGPVTYLHGYQNAAPPRENSCGQAAMATVLDAWGFNPYNLSNSVYDDQDGRWHWDNDTAVNAIQDSYPDRWIALVGEVGIFPDDISGALANLSSGMTTQAYAAGDNNWEQQWEALVSRMQFGRPTIVLLDAAALNWGPPASGHYVVAYNYDDASGSICVTNTYNSDGSPWIAKDQFLNAWRCWVYAVAGWGHVLIDFYRS
jgi:hypothetical protein